MSDVEIYTRQLCGFCTAAKSLLQKKGIGFREFDATYDPDLRKEMVTKAGGSSTFPQIFINGEHIGGCDELMALESSGKLDERLSA